MHDCQFSLFKQSAYVTIHRAQRHARLKPPNAHPRLLDAERLVGPRKNLR